MTTIENMTEEQWENQMNDYRQRLATIRIPLEINPGVAKGLLSRIDTFFSEVRLDLSHLDGRKEYMSSLIREVERQKAIGSNEMDRKRNATMSLQNFETNDGSIVNLYEVQRTLIQRSSYLQGVVDIIAGKQARLITITGVLKLEKDLMPTSAQQLL